MRMTLLEALSKIKASGGKVVHLELVFGKASRFLPIPIYDFEWICKDNPEDMQVEYGCDEGKHTVCEPW